MTLQFHASLSLVAFTVSVTCIFSHFVSPPYNLCRCFPLLWFSLILSAVTRCFLIIRPNKAIWCFRIIFMSDLMSASRNTVSFDFIAVHEIPSIFVR